MQIAKTPLIYWYSWGVKIINTSEAVIRLPYTLGHFTECGPLGLGQYNGQGYCGPHTACVSSFSMLANGVIRRDLSRLMYDLQRLIAMCATLLHKAVDRRNIVCSLEGWFL